MTKKLKSDYTPDEWAVIAAKRRAWQVANRERTNASVQRRNKSEKGQESLRRYRAERKERQQTRDPVGYAQRRNEHNRTYLAKLKTTDPEKHLIWRRRHYYKKNGMPRASAKVVMACVKAALPRSLPRHIGDDVTGAIMLAILHGEIAASEAASSIPKFVRAYNRQFDHHKVLSLNEKIPGMETSWLDALPDDAEHF